MKATVKMNTANLSRDGNEMLKTHGNSNSTTTRPSHKDEQDVDEDRMKF